MSRRPSMPKSSGSHDSDPILADREHRRQPSFQSVFVAPSLRRPPSLPKLTNRGGATPIKRFRRLAAFLQNPKVALATANIVVLAYLLHRSSPPTPPVQISPYKIPIALDDRNVTVVTVYAPAQTVIVAAPVAAPVAPPPPPPPSPVDLGTESCETCVVSPEHPLCEYGLDK
ncbi:hypothetical protein RQP46_000196 [Phenoliferia psychrophenolica]